MNHVTEHQSDKSSHQADWQVLEGRLTTWFEASSLTDGAALAVQVCELAGSDDVDIDLRHNGARVRLDAPLERVSADISAAARQLGLRANPGALQSVRLVVDSVDIDSVHPFWQTVFAYDADADGALIDPFRRDPEIAFDRIDQARPLRNRIHVDVVRPTAAVMAARTTVGTEVFGPYGVCLADADGNEIDVVPGDVLPDAPGAEDWQAVFSAVACYRTTSVQQAGKFISTVADIAQRAAVPLMIDLRPGRVILDSGKDLWEDDGQGSAARFAEVARQVQEAAHAVALSPDPDSARFVQLAFDAVDIPSVQAFWLSLLGFEHDPRPQLTDIVDPRRLTPVIMFQSLDEEDTERRQQRDRIRVELIVPHDQLQSRTALAVDAGGRVISSDDQTSRTRIADPEGNEVELVGES